MPRRAPPLASKELTLESIEKLDYYHVLGLTEAASSEEIEQALHVERWPWHLVEEGGREFVTAKRVEAYGVLNDPVSRLAYDKAQGYTKGQLAARIGDETSIWGQAWLILFGDNRAHHGRRRAASPRESDRKRVCAGVRRSDRPKRRGVRLPALPGAIRERIPQYERLLGIGAQWVRTMGHSSHPHDRGWACSALAG